MEPVFTIHEMLWCALQVVVLQSIFKCQYIPLPYEGFILFIISCTYSQAETTG